MEDPLGRFDWVSLYDNYDACCRRFEPLYPELDRFGRNRPASDRALYCRLIEAYSLSSRAQESDPVGTYRALLYWKLYSQHTTAQMFTDWSRKGEFDRAATELPRLLASLPPVIERDVDAVVKARRLQNTWHDVPWHDSGSNHVLALHLPFYSAHR